MRKLFSFQLSWRNIDLPLLIFLIFFLNVKFVVKLFAILFIVLYCRNLKFRFTVRNNRIPLFYVLIIVLELIKYLVITQNYTFNYSLVFGLGMLQWSISLLALHHIKLMLEKDNTEKVHDTIKAFFLLNFAVSIFFLAILIFHPSWLSFWGHGTNASFSSPSAGDTILGISFDTSTVNATFNSLGIIYFLYKRDYFFSLLCIIVVVLCTSNVTFLLLIATLGLMFISVKSKNLRIAVLISALILTFLYLLISPSNREYIRNYFVQLYILNNKPELAETKKDTLILDHDTILIEKQSDSVNKTNTDSIYSIDKQKLKSAINNLVKIKEDSSLTSPQMILSDEDFNRKPGKLISFFQTYVYLKSNISRFLLGAGIGNFSSKLAFRASGVGILGTYPRKYQYTSPEFEKNHLRTFLFYYNSEASKHSVLNYPFSVYNQLLGEYGMAGGLMFMVFYLGYFIKRYRYLTYGRYLIFMLLGFFLMEYWFEMFSLVILFEFFMLLNIKEKQFVSGNA